MARILDLNYRRWDLASNSEIVGWPRPTAEDPRTPYQRMAAMMPELRAAGFSIIKLPPSCRGGAGIFSAGYDKFDDYGLDGTAFGNARQLRQVVAVARANGIEVWGELVLHQYGGGRGGFYSTKRFPKHPTCFAADTTPGGVPPDPVPDQTGNFGFGDRAAYEHSLPEGYMREGAIAASVWLTETTGFTGYRIDDVKGSYVPVVAAIIHNPALAHLRFVGEYFEGSNDPLWNWVHNSMSGRSAVYDFGFKFNVGGICNNNSRSWMGRLAEIGYCSIDAFHAVTFVESADSDNSPGQQTIDNKILGYAFMLTFPGDTQTYIRDWADLAFCYDLKAHINNLLWIHANLAQGDFVVRHSSYQVFVHERLGFDHSPGCICFFNNDQWNDYTVTVATSLPPHTRVHEHTGNGEYNDKWTDDRGQLTVTVPRNDNGLSYLVYAVPIGDRPFTPRALPTTQVFYGAADFGNLVGNAELEVEAVDIAAGSTVDVLLEVIDHVGWTADSAVVVDIMDSAGEALAQGTARGVSVAVITTAHRSGWHRITLKGNALPATGSAWRLSIKYTAPTHATTG